MNLIHTLISISLSLILASPSNAFNFEQFTNGVYQLLNDTDYALHFTDHINKCLSIDPNYYEFKNNLEFECSLEPSNEVPSSVHQLRPADIRVVAALGDSLTASVGTKAHTVFGLLIEYRQVSWSMGGEANLDKVITLPNILKKFNPKLVGASECPTFALTSKKGAGFNAAVSGSKAYNLVNQAKILIQRMKESKEVDFQNDWKLVTLFIGGNDLCQFCKNKTLHSPQSYIDDIRDALDLMQNELPRTLVNLVNPLNVADIKELNVGLACSLLHRFECPCAAYPKSAEEEKQLNEFHQQYSNYTEELCKSGRYDTKNDFTVVYQPFFREFRAPRLPNNEIDISYFAPDCFHFSSKAQGKL